MWSALDSFKVNSREFVLVRVLDRVSRSVNGDAPARRKVVALWERPDVATPTEVRHVNPSSPVNRIPTKSGYIPGRPSHHCGTGELRDDLTHIDPSFTIKCIEPIIDAG